VIGPRRRPVVLSSGNKKIWFVYGAKREKTFRGGGGRWRGFEKKYRQNAVSVELFLPF